LLAIETQAKGRTNAHELQASDTGRADLGYDQHHDAPGRELRTRGYILDQDGLTDTPILTDLRAVSKFLANLSANAIKFQPDDDIAAELPMNMEGRRAPILHIGSWPIMARVSHHDLKRILKIYVSLDVGTSERTGGTGWAWHRGRLGTGWARHHHLRLGSW